MSGATHTPGPWSVIPDIRASVYRGEADTLVGYDIVADGVCIVGCEGIDGDGEANARVMAAAPDLLEASDELVDFIKAHVPLLAENPLVNDLTVAIAKARGDA